MFKKIIIVITGILLCYLVAYFSPLALQGLKPETKAALEYTPTVSFEDNSFIALLAITAPSESDFLFLGKTVATRAVKTPLWAKLKPYKSPDGLLLASNNESIEQEPYYILPCYYDSVSEHCISDILAERPIISWHLAQNALLLERYQAITKLSIYENTIDSHADLLPRFNNAATYKYNLLTKLSDLRVAEAVIAIVQGNAAKGLATLEAEINFYRGMLAGRTSLLETDIATRQLLVMYRVLSELIATYKLPIKDHLEQLTRLIKPLSETEQQTLAFGFELARSKRLSELNQLTPNTPAWKTLLFYDKGATLNAVYLNYQLAIDKALLTKDEALNYKINTVSNTFESTLFPSRNLIGANILEKYLNRLNQTDTQELFDSLYNLNSYLYLINAQLKILQVDTQSTEISEALKELGDLAKNPYTGQAFTWKKTTNTLSFPNFTKGKCCYADFEVIINPVP